MGLYKQNAAYFERLHHFMRGQMGILEMFKSRAGYDDVKLLLTHCLGQAMNIGHDVDVRTGGNIGAQVLAGVGNPIIVACGASGYGAHGAQFQYAGMGHCLTVGDEIFE